MPGAPLGALVIELEARRRLRANGRVAWRLSRSLGVDLAEVFWNCPRYTQRRERVDAPPAGGPPEGAQGATTHAERGPDASHRGGAPGFVRVLAPDTLELPDYAGNHMFQTLGNVALDARVGLAFPDLARGRVLERALPGAPRWRLAEPSPHNPPAPAATMRAL